MALVTLYCKGAGGLKLGPGSPADGDVLIFVNHYCTTTDEELDEPHGNLGTPRSWINGFGCPPIVIVNVEDVPSSDPTAVECPVCGIPRSPGARLDACIFSHRPGGPRPIKKLDLNIVGPEFAEG
jgi:hypothetical protein